jgi:hypothetical protein
MKEIRKNKRNSVVMYFIMLFLIVWSSFMFFGIQLTINMLFANLFLVGQFGILGVVIYLPFIFLILLLTFPFYFLFKKIYNIVIRSSVSFKSNKINLFFSFIFYYGIPFLFSVIIANKVLENYRLQSFAQKSIVIASSIVVIFILDYISNKISPKKNPKLKLNN